MKAVRKHHAAHGTVGVQNATTFRRLKTQQAQLVRADGHSKHALRSATVVNGPSSTRQGKPYRQKPLLGLRREAGTTTRQASLESWPEQDSKKAPAWGREFAAAQKSWAGVLTDPREHRDDSYLYLTHALRPDLLGHYGRSVRSVHEHLTNNPGDYIVSTGLVSNEFAQLYGSGIGFIIDAPPDNIITAGMGDLGVANNRGGDVAYYRRKLREEGLAEPHALAKESAEKVDANEVAVATIGQEGRRIRVVGVILDYKYLNIFLTGKNPGETEQLIADAKNLAHELDLPIIELDRGAWLDGEPVKVR